MTSLSRITAAMVAVAILWAAVWSAAASAAQLDKAQVEQIIHDYLLKNPQVIEDALIQLQRQADDDQAKARVAAVKTNDKLLLASSHQAVLGNPQGDVTVVEFFDYNCPYCRKAAADVAAVIGQDPKLRVVLKEWPILSAASVDAAQVSIAVRMQDGGTRFKAFHERLLGGRGLVDRSTALAAAVAEGYDAQKIQNDLASGEVKATIAEVFSLANTLGIQGTPTFVVDRQLISGSIGVDALKNLISKAREDCLQQPC